MSGYTPVDYATGGVGVAALASVDVNGDGLPDIVVENNASATDQHTGSITVLINNGAGGYLPAATYKLPVVYSADNYSTFGTPLATADLNGDGLPDLLISSPYSTTGFLVMLNNGQGGFLPATPVNVDGDTVASVVAADLNGDGKPDAIATADNDVAVLLGDGAGGFAAPALYGVGAGATPELVAVGDVNGDGSPDVVTANLGADGSTSISVLLNNGNGTLGVPTTYTLPTSSSGFAPTALTVADANGDGSPDIIVADADGSAILVLLNNGHGGFEPPTTYDVPAAGYGPEIGSIVVTDANGDGAPDIAFGGVIGFDNEQPFPLPIFGTTVLLNDGTGHFGATESIPYIMALAAADANGDGKLDFIGIDDSDPTLATSLAVDYAWGPGQFILGPASGGATLNGTYGNDLVVARGWGNTIFPGGGQDTVLAGAGGAAVNLGVGNADVRLHGYDSTVTDPSGTFDDGNNTVSGGLGGTTISLGNGNNDIGVAGWGNVIFVGDGIDKIVDYGGGATITAGDNNDTIAAAGYDNTIRVVGLGAPNDVIAAGAGEDTISIWTGNLQLNLAGWDNNVSLGMDAQGFWLGVNAFISAGHGGNDAITVNTNSSATISGGVGSTVQIGLDARLDDQSSGLTVVYDTTFGGGDPPFGTSQISNFTADPASVLDIVNSIADFTSVDQVLASLTSDGNGGTLFDAQRSGHGIDFIDTPISALTANHFKIG